MDPTIPTYNKHMIFKKNLDLLKIAYVLFG